MKSMPVYVTTETREVLKKNFLNLRFFGLISVADIIQTIGEPYEHMSLQSQFIVNKTIIREFDRALKRSRFYAIFFSNPWLNRESIINLHEYLSKHPNVKKIILLDYKDHPKNEEFFQMFDEVAFFPSIKKIKIFDCEVQRPALLY